jgi:hypothetical protein
MYDFMCVCITVRVSVHSVVYLTNQRPKLRIYLVRRLVDMSVCMCDCV